MSSFTGAASGGTAGVGPFAADNWRLKEVANLEFVTRNPHPAEAFQHTIGFSTPWWPGGGGLDASGGEWLPTVRFQRIEVTRGHSGRLGFAGVTRDVYGTAVPGAVVKLFRTANDSLQYSGTSGSDGSFTATTPYSDAHYLVSHKDDVIDTAGATVNTLIPA